MYRSVIRAERLREIEIRRGARRLRESLDKLNLEGAAVPKTNVEDEYAKAAERDPKILIITPQDPSDLLVKVAEELKFVFPNAQPMNRGIQALSQIIETCRAHDFTDAVFVDEICGVPRHLYITHLPTGPTAYFELAYADPAHLMINKKDMGTIPQDYPQVILDNFTTKLGERTANILKHLFPVPKPDAKRIITFTNVNDIISLRHHTVEAHGDPNAIGKEEIGPRFDLLLVEIKLGTIDQIGAKTEWLGEPSMNFSNLIS